MLIAKIYLYFYGMKPPPMLSLSGIDHQLSPKGQNPLQSMDQQEARHFHPQGIQIKSLCS